MHVVLSIRKRPDQYCLHQAIPIQKNATVAVPCLSCSFAVLNWNRGPNFVMYIMLRASDAGVTDLQNTLARRLQTLDFRMLFSAKIVMRDKNEGKILTK